MAVKWILIAVAAVLVGVSVGAVSLWREQSAREETLVAPAAADVREASIEGVLSAVNVVSIPAPIEGVLEMVRIDIGDEVFENMPLAQVSNTAIDDELAAAREKLAGAETRQNRLESDVIAAKLEASRARADLSRAREQYDRAQRAAARQRMLYRQGATPRQVYEKAQKEAAERRQEFDVVQEAEQKAAERVRRTQDDLDAQKRTVDAVNAEIDEISQDLDRAQIVSPVNGIVTGMAARQGEEVNPGMEALFQIAVDLTDMQVILKPAPEQMDLLRPGLSVQVYVAEAGGGPLEGTVTDMKVGRAVVEFKNPTPRIRPGLTAIVRIRRRGGE